MFVYKNVEQMQPTERVYVPFQIHKIWGCFMRIVT